MINILTKIETCSACTSVLYSEAIKNNPKACIAFHADRFLKLPVKNLFIAEAPPPTEPRYFYNTEIYGGTLRKGLFKLLGIGDYGEKGLEIFSQDSFLIDTIKCRVDKKLAGHKIPQEVLEKCAGRFLQSEIDFIQPKNIILLGKTALSGLAQLNQFKVLQNLHVKKDCGRTFQCGEYKVILYAYPSFRNKKIIENKPLMALL